MEEKQGRIRPAREGEAEVLTELALRSKAHWGYDPAFMAACREELTLTRDRMRRRLEVAEEGGRVVGFIELTPEGKGVMRLVSLYVDPSFHGCGWGRRLWERATTLTPEAECTAMIWDADPHAEEFYRRMGGRRTGEAPSESIPGRILPRMQIDWEPAGQCSVCTGRL
ncbi:GNAT family N-acetyltransferase [Melghirimyces profundicolus]|uniref:GNAT family N-acetyltransferase n=1 Tax=Melghirimyces profundicolus TaxID=1242148 RepID=UPI001FE6FAFB|nr:GNAT family N-acetyltransferase [Melghirimyces profundicolus]